MKKTWSKRFIAILLFVVMLAWGNLNPYAECITVQAATKKQNAINAYRKYLSATTQDWGGNEYNTSDFTFSLVDINLDGIKELIVENTVAFTVDCYQRVFTYYKGKMKEMISCYAGDVDKIYPKKDVFVVTGMHQGGNWTYYYKMSNGSVKKVAEETSYESMASDFEDLVNKYYVNEEETSELEYKSYVKKIIGSTKAVAYKLHKNSSADRKKYLK